MGRETLVELEVSAARQLLNRFVAEGVPVAAAVWLKEANEGQWALYLVTPLVGKDGTVRNAYRQVDRVAREMQECSAVDSLLIKVVGPTEPTGQAILDLRKRYPVRGDRYVRLGGESIGEVFVEDAYLYSLLTDLVANGESKATNR